MKKIKSMLCRLKSAAYTADKPDAILSDDNIVHRGGYQFT